MYNRPHLLQLTHHELIVFSSVAPCRIWAHSVDQKMGFVCVFLSECLCRAEELDLNSARPFQMSLVYSVKSSVFVGTAANYDSASSCIISSTWSGSCSPMAPLLWTILGSPEHLQMWRSLWGISKKNMVKYLEFPVPVILIPMFLAWAKTPHEFWGLQVELKEAKSI